MNNSSYWNSYYSGGNKKPSLPSQFAAFIAGEIRNEQIGTIIDIGCGNGRDAIFFARHGFPVLGLDASEEAITFCKTQAKELNASFLVSDINDQSLPTQLEQIIPSDNLPFLYSRFFLHAIDEDAEKSFIQLAAKICPKNARFALEFRTTRDRQQPKETDAHYRRYIEPLDFVANAIASGFSLEYFVEGFGFAKFGADDAYVARVILRKKI